MVAWNIGRIADQFGCFWKKKPGGSVCTKLYYNWLSDHSIFYIIILRTGIDSSKKINAGCSCSRKKTFLIYTLFLPWVINVGTVFQFDNKTGIKSFEFLRGQVTGLKKFIEDQRLKPIYIKHKEKTYGWNVEQGCRRYCTKTRISGVFTYWTRMASKKPATCWSTLIQTAQTKKSPCQFALGVCPKHGPPRW